MKSLGLAKLDSSHRLTNSRELYPAFSKNFAKISAGKNQHGVTILNYFERDSLLSKAPQGCLFAPKKTSHIPLSGSLPALRNP
jgi:hypothetical protein